MGKGGRQEVRGRILNPSYPQTMLRGRSLAYLFLFSKSRSSSMLISFIWPYCSVGVM